MNKKSLAAMLPLVLIAAGCGTQSSTSSPALPTTATIALAPQVSPNWWFPVLSSSAYSDTNLQMNALMYVPLLHISRTDGIDFSRSLAEKITHNADGTVYTIDLNPKYHWSNGQPVTARDVVFTWQILKATSSGASNLPWGYGGAGTGGIPTDWASVVAKIPLHRSRHFEKTSESRMV